MRCCAGPAGSESQSQSLSLPASAETATPAGAARRSAETLTFPKSSHSDGTPYPRANTPPTVPPRIPQAAGRGLPHSAPGTGRYATRRGPSRTSTSTCTHTSSLRACQRPRSAPLSSEPRPAAGSAQPGPDRLAAARGLAGPLVRSGVRRQPALATSAGGEAHPRKTVTRGPGVDI